MKFKQTRMVNVESIKWLLMSVFSFGVAVGIILSMLILYLF